MAVGALDALRLMRTREPVPHVIGLGVAAQAGAVGLLRHAILEADDLVFRFFRVAAGRHVQTASSMTLLALHITQEMLAAAVNLVYVGVTLRALICADFGGSRNVNELAEILVLFLGGLC